MSRSSRRVAIMTTIDSADAFRRSVSDRSAAFQDAVNKVMEAFAQTDKDVLFHCNRELLRASRDLGAILSRQDVPHWFQPIVSAAVEHAKANTIASARVLLTTINDRLLEIKPIDLTENQTSSIDFDALYENFRDKGCLEDLFDKTIELLDKIITSEEIEGVTILDSLKQLLDILEKRGASGGQPKRSD